jgi:hypothetical protein
MTWDDVATQMRALVDAVPPVETDEVVGRPAPSGPRSAGWWKPAIGVAAAAALIAGTAWLLRSDSDDGGASDADVSTDGRGDPAETGPLALARPGRVIAEAGITGQLRITGDCTFIGDTLLVWPADRTRWSPGDGAIVFDQADGGRLELHDGEQITLGGAGRDATAAGAGGLAPIDWVVEAQPSCPTDHMWIVGASATVPG